MADYNIILCVDFNEPALKTFAYNHHGSKTLCDDLSVPETFEEINRLIEGRTIDVIVGGPPCQGFRLTGPRQFNDDCNKLYLAMIETVQKYRPKAILIKNVLGMATLYKGEVRDDIVRSFSKIGYNVNYKILCSADYGVPQTRELLWIFGILVNYPTISF